MLLIFCAIFRNQNHKAKPDSAILKDLYSYSTKYPSFLRRPEYRQEKVRWGANKRNYLRHRIVWGKRYS